jgi:hypothetical protein
MKVDTFAPAFDFWSVVDEDTVSLRHRWEIPALDAMHAGTGTPHPIRPWEGTIAAS